MTFLAFKINAILRNSFILNTLFQRISIRFLLGSIIITLFLKSILSFYIGTLTYPLELAFEVFTLLVFCVFFFYFAHLRRAWLKSKTKKILMAIFYQEDPLNKK